MWGTKHHGGCCGLLSTSGSVDGVRARRFGRVKRVASVTCRVSNPCPQDGRYIGAATILYESLKSPVPDSLGCR